MYWGLREMIWRTVARIKRMNMITKRMPLMSTNMVTVIRMLTTATAILVTCLNRMLLQHVSPPEAGLSGRPAASSDHLRRLSLHSEHNSKYQLKFNTWRIWDIYLESYQTALKIKNVAGMKWVTKSQYNSLKLVPMIVLSMSTLSMVEWNWQIHKTFSISIENIKCSWHGNKSVNNNIVRTNYSY